MQMQVLNLSFNTLFFKYLNFVCPFKLIHIYLHLNVYATVPFCHISIIFILNILNKSNKSVP